MPDIRARSNLLVIGIGNLLRGDDQVGIHVVQRLQTIFGSSLQCMEIAAPDIVLAETLSQVQEAVIVDAMRMDPLEFYRMIRLFPSKENLGSVRFSAHVLDWASILSLSESVYGRAPAAYLLGIRAVEFGFSEHMSEICRQSAEAAFDFLVQHCSRRD